MKTQLDKNGRPVEPMLVSFRWPIEQISEDKIVVNVPVGPDAPPLIEPCTAAIKSLKLTDREVDRMIGEANEAALRAILVKD